MAAFQSVIGNRRLSILRGWRRWALIGFLVVAISAVVLGAVRLTHPAPQIPTTEVKRGLFTDYLRLRAQLLALKSVTLTAPMEAGINLQILKLVKNGDQVKPGDVVVQFDASKLEQTLDQKRSALKQAEAETGQTSAQARSTEEQDKTDLIEADYDVERASLEASKQEILSKIQGAEDRLALADAEQRLKQTEQRLKSHQDDAAVDLEEQKQKRDKALFDVRQAERQIALLTVRAPIGGLVTLLPNWRAGGFLGSVPDYKQGDQAWPGAGIAELPVLSTLEVEARVDEVDRGRVQVGLPVTVRVDAVPDKEFQGQVSVISALAKIDFQSGWPFSRNFDLRVRLQEVDPRLRPGMSASVRVAVDHVPNAILIPAEASFQKGGATVAYVLKGPKFEERPIEVARKSEGQLAVARGLEAGEKVALKDPTEGKRD
jgi:RND family efflux transporter MFP subunit